MARGRRRSLACLLVAASLAAAFLGCRREDPKIRALTERAAQADDAAQQLRRAWRAQLGRLTLAGIKGLRPEDEPMPLTGEQKRALEARVRLEKDSSRRGLLREILDADLEIQSLNGRLRDLRADLPAPEVVRSNDSHYGLAMRFLKARGCSEEQARAALSRVTLSERVTPGFEVYHFYVDGQYGTWVAQGRVPISPRELTREDADTLPAERDEAVARGRRLQRELGLLETQKRRIEEEIAAIHEERAPCSRGTPNCRRRTPSSWPG